MKTLFYFVAICLKWRMISTLKKAPLAKVVFEGLSGAYIKKLKIVLAVISKPLLQKESFLTGINADLYSLTVASLPFPL